MQKYEMLILLRSDMEEEAREAELKKYADIVTSMGGSVDLRSTRKDHRRTQPRCGNFGRRHPLCHHKSRGKVNE